MAAHLFIPIKLLSYIFLAHEKKRILWWLFIYWTLLVSPEQLNRYLYLSNPTLFSILCCRGMLCLPSPQPPWRFWCGFWPTALWAAALQTRARTGTARPPTVRPCWLWAAWGRWCSAYWPQALTSGKWRSPQSWKTTSSCSTQTRLLLWLLDSNSSPRAKCQHWADTGRADSWRCK